MRSKAALWAVCVAVCCYYLWAATRYTELSPNGYYNYLARGWAEGHLYVPIVPDPRLLAQANPYDPNLPDEIKVHDMVLFGGRYYLYHGPAAAALTFYPFRVVTGKALPEPIAVFVLVSVAFLANAFSLRRLNPGAGALAYAALGLANGIPFLLHRIWVYEVAIACGQATLSVAIALHVAERFRWSGLCLGLLALSRPHLMLVSLVSDRRAWPLVPIGLGLAGLHNWLRFGNPADFGLAHLIAGPSQQMPAFSVGFVLPSLYLFLLELPRWVGVFPYLALHSQPAIELPPLFFHENMVGAFWLAPFAFLKQPVWRLSLAAFLILGFLSTTGWVTERYLVDFLPLLVLASLAGKGNSWWGSVLMGIGIVVNLILHVQGPYNAP